MTDKKDGAHLLKALFFDLDGTLTDSAPGITKCTQLALRHFGIPADDLDALRVFIGPPLRETFPKFGVPEDRVEEAVRVFRSRYLVTGKFENAPYDGIREMLSRLKGAGARLYVATSKPETTATEILQHFDLDGYFTLICGATMDGARDSKESVLRYLLKETGGDPADALMIGDTKYDMLGAAALGIPGVGVTWGFGSREELLKSGAGYLAETPEELGEYLIHHS